MVVLYQAWQFHFNWMLQTMKSDAGQPCIANKNLHRSWIVLLHSLTSFPSMNHGVACCSASRRLDIFAYKWPVNQPFMCVSSCRPQDSSWTLIAWQVGNVVVRLQSFLDVRTLYAWTFWLQRQRKWVHLMSKSDAIWGHAYRQHTKM